jgi:hypothetical protein
VCRPSAGVGKEEGCIGAGEEEGGVGADEEEDGNDGENEEGMLRMEGAIKRTTTRDDVVVRLSGGTESPMFGVGN